jgi:hypothetical protein
MDRSIWACSEDMDAPGSVPHLALPLHWMSAVAVRKGARCMKTMAKRYTSMVVMVRGRRSADDEENNPSHRRLNRNMETELGLLQSAWKRGRYVV